MLHRETASIEVVAHRRRGYQQRLARGLLEEHKDVAVDADGRARPHIWHHLLSCGASFRWVLLGLTPVLCTQPTNSVT